MQRLRRFVRRYGPVLGLLLFVSAFGTWFTGVEKTLDVACRYVPGWRELSPVGCDRSRTTLAEPRQTIYERQLQQYKVAIADSDEAFLAALDLTGFKPEPKDLCKVVSWLSDRKGPKVHAPAAVSIFLKSVDLDSTCPASWILRREKTSIAVALLEHGLSHMDSVKAEEGFEGGGCGIEKVTEYWPRQVDLIIRLFEAHGRAQDFDVAVKAYLDLFETLETLPNNAYVEACANRMIDGDQPVAAPEFIFGNACIHPRQDGYWTGVRATAKVEMSEPGDNVDVGEQQKLALRAEALRACQTSGPLDLTRYTHQLQTWIN